MPQPTSALLRSKHARRLVGCFVLAALILAIWSLAPNPFLPSGTTIISKWYTDALKDCSQEFATGRTDFWLPTAQQIAEFEMQMATQMHDREKAGLMVPPPGQRFNGQYIGFMRKDVRYIYGNFYPSNMVDDERWTGQWSPFEQPRCVADGGRYFWGIVYDPEKKQLEEPRFNGQG